MGLPIRDREHHDCGDYRHWGDDVRYALIDEVTIHWDALVERLPPLGP